MMKRLSLCAIAPLFFFACAGSVEGEIDGDSLPALLSGVWTEGDAGDLVSINVSATSMLDTCGTMIRLFEARTEVVEEQTDEIDGDTDAEDALDDLFKALDDVDATILPEDFWAVSVSVVVEDTDDLAGGSFDQDDLGEEGGMFVVVCHQEGFPDRDRESGGDDNATCFLSSDSKGDVNGFDKKGGIDLTAEAELVQAEDLEEEAGDIELSLRASACPDLEDANDDFNDALGDFFEELGPSDGIPDGPDGPDGEPGLCSFDDECFGAHQLCDTSFGECVTPEAVTGSCSAADFLFSSDLDGPLLFDATIESGFAACELPFLFTAAFHDDQGDFSPTVSDVTARDGNGLSIFIDSVSIEGGVDGAIAISFCANDFGDVAFQLRDLNLNDSNPTCANL